MHEPPILAALETFDVVDSTWNRNCSRAKIHSLRMLLRVILDYNSVLFSKLMVINTSVRFFRKEESVDFISVPAYSTTESDFSRPYTALNHSNLHRLCESCMAIVALKHDSSHKNTSMYSCNKEVYMILTRRRETCAHDGQISGYSSTAFTSPSYAHDTLHVTM